MHSRSHVDKNTTYPCIFLQPHALNHRYYRISPSVGHTHGTGSHVHLHIHLHMHPHICIRTLRQSMPLTHCPRRTAPAPALTFFRRSPSNFVQRSSKIKSKIEKTLYISSFEQAQHASPTTHSECQRRLRKSYTSQKSARGVGSGGLASKIYTHTCPSLHTSALTCVHHFDTAKTQGYTHINRTHVVYPATKKRWTGLFAVSLVIWPSPV